jgi:mycofactocin precursor peptide peptidase
VPWEVIIVGPTTPDPDKRDGAPGPASLGSERSPAVAARSPLGLLVPLGSCEQHGPHLPLDTDTRIAVAVAERVAAARPGVAVAPPVAYGSSGEHQSFAGTLSIGTEALRSVLVELGRSALPGGAADPAFAWVVLVNGHGGNVDAVRGALEILAEEGRPVSAWWPSVPGGDAHAGSTETSVLLALDPDLVGPERPVGATAPVADLLPRMRTGGVAAVSPDGVLGDATEASAELGEEVLGALVADLARHVDAHLDGRWLGS